MKKNFCLGLLMSCLITGNVGLAADFIPASNEGFKVIADEQTVTDEKYIVDDTKETESYKHAIYVTTDGKLSVLSNDITINHQVINNTNDTGWRRCAVNAVAGGHVVLGTDTTENININTITNNDIAVGLHAWRDNGSDGGSIEVNGKNLNVNIKSDNYFAYGIYVYNNTTPDSANDNVKSNVVINSENTVINVQGADTGYANGIIAWSEGSVKINNGNVFINADGNIINTRGNSLVEINKDNNVNHTVQLNGDIVFEYNKYDSGTPVDSDVNINLSNAESYLSGNIAVTGNPPEKKDDVTGMKLGLSNGAQWTTDEESFVNTLNFNGGIININGGEGHKVRLDKVKGTGGTVNIKAEIEEDKSVTSGTLNIGKDGVTDGTLNNLAVNFTGITADNFADKQKAADALKKLAGNVTVKEDQKIDNSTATIKEGIVSGAVSGDMTFNGGTGSVEIDKVNQNTSTTTMDNMRDVASVALVAWRQEDSTLSQRLGELRSSEGDQGIWARMSRGEFEYGGAFKNQYNYFQLGYDWAAGDWHYGAAVSHNDGQTTYASGNGENDSTSLTLYGTWLGDKGQYTDIVVKQGKLNNEFTNYAEAGVTTGDYDMWGTSISAEYGQKLEMKNDWYVTPQAQLTYMRIGGEDYTATVTKDGKSNPMQVSQDGMDSFVGRIGFEAGKNISEKGSIYAKASLLHEFAGEADTTLVYMGKPGTYSQDLGDTWYECGFGVNYKTSDNSYVYADVVKTFGGDVETPWQWNAGMRWSF